MKEKTVEKKPLLARFMDGVETVCNKLPPPTMLFVFPVSYTHLTLPTTPYV